MSYYALDKGTNVLEAAAGLGAFIRSNDGGRFKAWRTLPMAYAGLGLVASEFNGAKGWADQTACDAAWQTSKTTIPQCKEWVNLMRAGLAKLGYGVLSQSVSWGAEDIAAYKDWCKKNGITVTTYPTKDGWTTMETQVKQGIVTGDKAPVEMVKSGDTWVPAGVVAGAGASTGLSAFKLGLIAVGVIGVAALAIAAKKRRGAAPVTGSLPSTASTMKANARRRRHRHRRHESHRMPYAFRF